MLRFFYLTDKKEFVKLLIIRLIVIGLGLLIPINTARAIDFAIAKDLDQTLKHIGIMVLLLGKTTPRPTLINFKGLIRR